MRWRSGVMVSSQERVEIGTIPHRSVTFNYIENRPGTRSCSAIRRRQNLSVLDEIAYQAQGDAPTGPNPDIFVTSLDGKGTKRLTDWPGAAMTPAWSPDGRSIAFASDRSAPRDTSGMPGGPLFGLDIYVMDSDGSRPRRITTSGGTSPAWSPDGLRIAFVGVTNARGGSGRLWLMSAAAVNTT